MQTIHVYEPGIGRLYTSYGPCVAVPSSVSAGDEYDVTESIRTWAIQNKLIAPYDEVAVIC